MFVMAEESEIASSYSRDWLARVVYNKHFHRVAAQLRKAIIVEEGSRAMDSRIWEQLSLGLVENVIASLPFPVFFRGRAVCKNWARYIFSPKFQAILSWADLSLTPPTFFFSYRLAILLPARPIVQIITDGLACRPSRAYPLKLKTSWQVTQCAGDGGLLYFQDRNSETEATGLFVSNPITQECRQLPDMLIFNTEPAARGYVWIFTQLLVDSVSSTGTVYALVVGLYDHRMRAYLEVYSSISNTWTTDTALPLHNLGVFFNPQNGALCNNALYCVVTERVDLVGPIDLFTLPTEPLYVRYLVSTELLGNWKKLHHFRAENRPLHMNNLQVVECLGSLFMVVGEWINYGASELEITIYLLLDGTAEGLTTKNPTGVQQEKVEVEKLSDVRRTEGYTCVGEGENICLLDLTSFLVRTM